MINKQKLTILFILFTVYISYTHTSIWNDEFHYVQNMYNLKKEGLKLITQNSFQHHPPLQELIFYNLIPSKLDFQFIHLIASIKTLLLFYFFYKLLNNLYSDTDINFLIAMIFVCTYSIFYVSIKMLNDSLCILMFIITLYVLTSNYNKQKKLILTIISVITLCLSRNIAIFYTVFLILIPSTLIYKIIILSIGINTILIWSFRLHLLSINNATLNITHNIISKISSNPNINIFSINNIFKVLHNIIVITPIMNIFVILSPIFLVYSNYKYKNATLIFTTLFIICNIILINETISRYMLPLLPIIFLFFAYIVNKKFYVKKYKIIFLYLILFLTVSYTLYFNELQNNYYKNYQLEIIKCTENLKTGEKIFTNNGRAITLFSPIKIQLTSLNDSNLIIVDKIERIEFKILRNKDVCYIECY